MVVVRFGPLHKSVSSEWSTRAIVAPATAGRPIVPEIFVAQVEVNREAGTIVWPNGVDLDPDVVFEATRRVG